jgi:hypothetical protein
MKQQESIYKKMTNAEREVASLLKYFGIFTPPNYKNTEIVI